MRRLWRTPDDEPKRRRRPPCASDPSARARGDEGACTTRAWAFTIASQPVASEGSSPSLSLDVPLEGRIRSPSRSLSERYRYLCVRGNGVLPVRSGIEFPFDWKRVSFSIGKHSSFLLLSKRRGRVPPPILRSGREGARSRSKRVKFSIPSKRDLDRWIAIFRPPELEALDPDGREVSINRSKVSINRSKVSMERGSGRTRVCIAFGASSWRRTTWRWSSSRKGTSCISKGGSKTP